MEWFLCYIPKTEVDFVDNILIVFASLTTANRIKSLLEKNHSVPSQVIQTPKAIPLKSCSYCLRIKEQYLYQSWNIIKNMDVYTKGVYRESDYSKIL